MNMIGASLGRIVPARFTSYPILARLIDDPRLIAENFLAGSSCIGEKLEPYLYEIS